jgi:hypothetical protein
MRTKSRETSFPEGKARSQFGRKIFFPYGKTLPQFKQPPCIEKLR